jgi:hypothetical protein
MLMGWAVHLSGYPEPEQMPRLEYRVHEFFVNEVCGQRECRVVGWYNDSGIVYVDERLKESASGFAKSLVVHELVHYLQHQSGKYDTYSCQDSLQREREAYSIQNDFLLQVGNAVTPMRPRPTSCRYGAAGRVREADAKRGPEMARAGEIADVTD